MKAIVRAIAPAICIYGFLTPITASALQLNVDESRVGGRVSSIDMDDNSVDDTVGIGAYWEAPFSAKAKLGLGFDYWSTDVRFNDSTDIDDVAIGAFGKYFFLAHEREVAPYGLAGLALHLIQVEDAEGNDDRRELSLDLGVGVNITVTPFVSLNAELRNRNIDNYDYADLSVGAVAKF